MIKFDTFYIQCPRCKSWMEGHLIISSMVNHSVLYSDGKILNDGYITENQKMIICPACSHWSWVEKYEEPYITKKRPKETFYTWNSWRFYGVHSVSNKGKMALVKHYENFLTNANYNLDQEIYFRRLLWWAFNDFVRDRYQVNIDCYTSKEMSFKVWYRNRKKILEGIKQSSKTQNKVIARVEIDNDETIILNNIEFFDNDELQMKINSNTKSSDVVTLKINDKYTEGELMTRLKNNGYSCR